MQGKEKAQLTETIERVNELFAGNVGEDDRFRYVYHVREKMLESYVLQTQAQGNSEAGHLQAGDRAFDLRAGFVQ